MAAPTEYMIKNTLTLIMIFGILVVMASAFTAHAVHEILGLLMTLLFILHNSLNHHWYTQVGQRKPCFFRTITVSLTLLLIVTMLLVIITGILISQTVFSVFSLGSHLWVHQLHGVSAYIGFILIAVHLGFHWKAMQGKLCRRLGIRWTSFAYVVWSRIAALMIIGYGIHASFLHHIGSKLLFKHVFYNGGNAPSLAGFFADYMAIMGCYIAITHYLILLLQNQKYKD